MPQPSPVEIQELRLLMGSARDPEGRVFAQLGDALRRAGERYEARLILEEGLEQHPSFVPGHLSLAWVLLEEGELEAARRAFQRTLELDEENPFGMYGLGLILRSQGDDAADGYLERARVLHPAVGEVTPRLSVEQISLASLPFLSLEELAPEPEAEAPADPLQSLPFASLEELAPTAAAEPGSLEVVEDAAAAEPLPADATPVTRTMAELMVRQGHEDRAITLYERLVEESPQDPSLRERLQELRDTVAGGGAGTDPVQPADDGERAHPALSSPEPAPSEPTPFAWTGDAADEEEPAGTEGPSVANYFGSLLSWSGEEGMGRSAGSASEPENP